MAPCVGFAIKRLAADGFGPPGAFLAQEPIVVLPAALGELAIEWSPVAPIALRAATRGLAPFARPPFVVGGPGGGDVHRPAIVALEPSLGVVVHFGKYRIARRGHRLIERYADPLPRQRCLERDRRGRPRAHAAHHRALQRGL